MKVVNLAVNTIKVPADRQRRELGDITSLANSIAQIGLVSPIVVTTSGDQVILVAGHRRLTACQKLGMESVPAVFLEDLDPVTRKIVELEENIKRKDLTWQEEADAIFEFHELTGGVNIETCRRLSISAGHLDRVLAYKRQVVNNPELAEARSISAAANIAKRIEERKLEALLEHPVKLKSNEVICADFFDWVRTYSGARFNLIHCDFPYGLNIDKAGSEYISYSGQYEDTPDMFFALLDALLENLDRIASDGCHLMFWFSMKFYQKTFDRLSTKFVVNPFPLIWTKSAGFVPDPQRGPRRAYETAFLCTRGDRKIVRVKSNWVSAQADNSAHPTAKPVPVLKHFMEMLVDESTRLLDPTCGSGTALRAAKDLGAAAVFGVEKDPDFAVSAKSLLSREVEV